MLPAPICSFSSSFFFFGAPAFLLFWLVWVVDFEEESESELESSLSFTFCLADFLVSLGGGQTGLLFVDFLTYLEEGTSSEEEDELDEDFLPVYFFGELLLLEESLELID